MFALTKTKLTYLLAVVMGLLILAAPLSVSSQKTDELCAGANLTFNIDRNSCDTGNPEGKINNLIEKIVNIFSIIVGIVAVIMIIYGGFRFITSGGDSGNVSSAKNTVLYAIVGLIIVALAQFIVKFVLAKLA